MPIKSDAQRGYLHANHPKIAKRWEKHTPKGDLPERVNTKEAQLRATRTAIAHALNDNSARTQLSAAPTTAKTAANRYRPIRNPLHGAARRLTASLFKAAAPVVGAVQDATAQLAEKQKAESK